MNHLKLSEFGLILFDHSVIVAGYKPLLIYTSIKYANRKLIKPREKGPYKDSSRKIFTICGIHYKNDFLAGAKAGPVQHLNQTVGG